MHSASNNLGDLQIFLEILSLPEAQELQPVLEHQQILDDPSLHQPLPFPAGWRGELRRVRGWLSVMNSLQCLGLPAFPQFPVVLLALEVPWVLPGRLVHAHP